MSAANFAKVFGSESDRKAPGDRVLARSSAGAYGPHRPIRCLTQLGNVISPLYAAWSTRYVTMNIRTASTTSIVGMSQRFVHQAGRRCRDVRAGLDSWPLGAIGSVGGMHLKADAA